MASLMRKSCSVDSSLSVVTHAAKRSATGLRTSSTEAFALKRARSPLSMASQPEVGPPPQSVPQLASTSIIGTAVIVASLLAVLAAAALVPGPLQDMMPWALEREFIPTNATENAAGCNGIGTLDSFSLDRFKGNWHHIAWLHDGEKPATFEHKVGRQCTTAHFSAAERRGMAGRFSVKYLTRPLTPGYVSASEGQEVTEVTGVGRTPNVSESAKMQVQLETSHVLPLWVVSTDYDSWALICTTSVSLGGGHPAKVMTLLSRSWALDRLDVGDRLNDLARLNLSWRDVSFADMKRCSKSQPI